MLLPEFLQVPSQPSKTTRQKNYFLGQLDGNMVSQQIIWKKINYLCIYLRRVSRRWIGCMDNKCIVSINDFLNKDGHAEIVVI